MPDANFNLRHLRAYRAVHETGSIRAASDAVHLSQPAITQALARLETRLGAPLFQRHSGGMTPTDAGDAFAPRIERALDGLRDGCLRACQKARKPRAPRLDLAISSTHLRALGAVAEQGNFTLAARSLGIAQPTLFRVARDLEQIAGFALYEKTRSGIGLTPAAEILNRAARLAFAELRLAVDDLAQLTGTATQTLRIGSLPLSRARLLPKAIAALTTGQPSLTVQVIDGPYDDLLHALRDGDLDMLIGALRDPVPTDDVIQHALFTDTLGIYCGSAHPLAGQQEVSLDDLAPYGWIVPRHGTPTRAAFDRFAQFLPREDGVIESSSLSLIRGLLGKTDRLTMISNHQAGGDPGLVRVSLHPDPIAANGRPIGITLRRGFVATQAQQRFIDLLQAAARSA